MWNMIEFDKLLPQSFRELKFLWHWQPFVAHARLWRVTHTWNSFHRPNLESGL